MSEQDDTDARIQGFYSDQFDESTRLTERSAAGRVEFERVQELILERIGPASRILDIGGGAGVHAAELARLGHSVVLIDPVARHVEAARQIGTFEARIGDARALDFETDSFDVALSFGALYHLSSREDRVGSLAEAARVVRPEGYVFAAAIPRTSRHAALTLGRDIPSPYPADLIGLLTAGTPDAESRFPGAHFHTTAELESEMDAAGLTDLYLTGIEGPAGLALDELPSTDEQAIRAALVIARRAGDIPELSDLSNHIMAIGRVP